MKSRLHHLEKESFPLCSSICRLLPLVATAAFLILIALNGYANAQAVTQAGAWSAPKLLFEDTNGFSRLDYMLADPNDALHIFWSHNPRSSYDPSGAYNESQTDILYVRLDRGEWLSSRDVLLNSQARMPFSALVDGNGTLHLATTAGGPPCVNYLTVDAERAGDPRAWPGNRCLEDISVGSPDLAMDTAGQFYILYPARGQMALELIRSSDGGRSWSAPVGVATASSREVFVTSQRLVVDATGRLHAVWGEVEAPGGYPYRRLLYAHSLDGGDTWSNPQELADARQGDPNLVVHGDSVHVAWNGDAGYKGRYYRASQDGGLTWSARITLPLPATTGGLQGPPAILADNTGTVHILYTDSPRLYYITLQDGNWSRPLEIAGPDNTGATSEINYPMLSITEGNQLHALYTRDAKAVYYQQRRIDAPAEAPVVRSTQATKPFPTDTPVPSANPQPTKPPVDLQGGSEAPASASGALPVLMGVVPAFILVMAAVVSYSMRRPR